MPTGLRLHAYRLAPTCLQACAYMPTGCAYMPTGLRLHAYRLAPTCLQACAYMPTGLCLHAYRLRLHAYRLAPTCLQACAYMPTGLCLHAYRLAPNNKAVAVQAVVEVPATQVASKDIQQIVQQIPTQGSCTYMSASTRWSAPDESLSCTLCFSHG
jgi:hypothetical protein